VCTGDYKFSRDADGRNNAFCGKMIKRARERTHPAEAVSKDARMRRINTHEEYYAFEQSN